MSDYMMVFKQQACDFKNDLHSVYVMNQCDAGRKWDCIIRGVPLQPLQSEILIKSCLWLAMFIRDAKKIQAKVKPVLLHISLHIFVFVLVS